MWEALFSAVEAFAYMGERFWTVRLPQCVTENAYGINLCAHFFHDECMYQWIILSCHSTDPPGETKYSLKVSRTDMDSAGCVRLVFLESLRPQPAETLIITPPPHHFQCTVVDMFQHDGHTYMTYADRLTGWMELTHFPTGATSQRVKTHQGRYFTQ
ncbi:hypothetical protein E2C01_023093 [Portunus trituberculatus]|uniref:Uncharacterized protein n=1 Tax=Portunus trituberculatus TaxID=210409 RepID=A0A5B7E750_PORTR|nr:hypothetical protein [Portunus trituberculatus]